MIQLVAEQCVPVKCVSVSTFFVYPHLTNCVLPFLPKPVAKRNGIQFMCVLKILQAEYMNMHFCVCVPVNKYIFLFSLEIGGESFFCLFGLFQTSLHVLNLF